MTELLEQWPALAVPVAMFFAKQYAKERKDRKAAERARSLSCRQNRYLTEACLRIHANAIESQNETTKQLLKAFAEERAKRRDD